MPPEYLIPTSHEPSSSNGDGAAELRHVGNNVNSGFNARNNSGEDVKLLPVTPTDSDDNESWVRSPEEILAHYPPGPKREAVEEWLNHPDYVGWQPEPQNLKRMALDGLYSWFNPIKHIARRQEREVLTAKHAVIEAAYRWSLVSNHGEHISRKGGEPINIDNRTDTSMPHDAREPLRNTNRSFSELREKYRRRIKKQFEVEGLKGSDIVISHRDRGGETNVNEETIPNVMDIDIAPSGNLVIIYQKTEKEPGADESIIDEYLVSIGEVSARDIRFA